MELIIKIPEEVYKTVQDGSYCGSLYEELKAAIPYNPSGDLISRSDALKAVDTRHEELLHDTEYHRKHCQIDLLGIKKHILAIPPAKVGENKYKRAFEIACDLLNGDNLYGIDTDILFAWIMQEHGVVSAFEYQKFILEHLDRFDDNDEVRLKAVEKLGW